MSGSAPDVRAHSTPSHIYLLRATFISLRSPLLGCTHTQQPCDFNIRCGSRYSQPTVNPLRVGLRFWNSSSLYRPAPTHAHSSRATIACDLEIESTNGQLISCIRTQQPCDDNMRSRDGTIPRSTRFVSGSGPGIRAHSTDSPPATGRVACDGL